MLVPAISKKAELLEKFSQEIYSEKYFWYNGYSYCHELPEIKAEDNLYQYAIVNKNNDVVGFLTYRVDSYVSNVYGFGLYSFGDGDITVGIDVHKILEELIEKYNRVEWQVVGGNKIKKNYDNFCKKHGGRILEYRNCVKDENGKYHNSYTYEILKDKPISVEKEKSDSIVYCKECKFAHMTHDGYCKNCDVFYELEDPYFTNNFFCGFGKRKESDE